MSKIDPRQWDDDREDRKRGKRQKKRRQRKENNRKNTIRKVTQANWKENNELYRFAISANSFLWQMARSIVGSLLALSSNQIEERDIKNYLYQKDLGRIPYVAPPEGLHLWKVKY